MAWPRLAHLRPIVPVGRVRTASVDTVLLVALALVSILLVSRGLRGVLERGRQPAVMAEVLAGIVLGASVLGQLPGDPSAALFTPDVREVLEVLGAVGIAAYLFVVAAELDPAALRRDGRALGAVAVASFLVPFAAGSGLALALHPTVEGEPPIAAFVLFVATATVVTALPVLARIVDDRGLRDAPSGRVALGAAASQELAVWPLLAIAVALGASGTADGTRGPGAVLALGAGAVALTLLLARVVVPRVPEPVRGVAALAGLGLSATATELSGLHLVLGAFLFATALPRRERAAGLALLRRRPVALAVAVALPVFFALGALRVDVSALGLEGLGLALAVVTVAAAAKLASGAVAARRAGLERREAATVGVLVNARGLVELVVLSVGLDAGLVDARLYAVFVVMALVTTFATGPLVDRVRRAGASRVASAPWRPATRSSR